MRILCTFAGGSGHFEPLVPIARAAQAAGHSVAFAAQAALVPTVVAAGFTAFDTGGTTVRNPSQRLPLLALDAQREDKALGESYAYHVARERASTLLVLCAEWQPELLVCDEVDFGAMICAERLGLPYATVLVTATGSFVRHGVVAEPLNALRAQHGLPPDPELRMLSRYLTLSPFPPSYRDPAFPLPATAHMFGPLALTPEAYNPLPAWPTFRHDCPTIYSTLGTVFNLESGDLFARVLAGLQALPCNVIATVGREIDPAEFGPQPPTVRIERYVPQGLVLPICDLVLSHGGSGSVLGALTHGLPMVLLPLGADQPHNAARCAALGAAQVLDAIAATPAGVREAVATVLAEASYRQAAERLRDEIAALPRPTIAVALLERLVAEGRPIVAT